MTQNVRTRATRRKRTAWWVFGSLVVAFALVPQLIISLWGASLAGRLLTRALNRPVSIQQISGGWLRSLEVQRLAITDGFEANSKTLLEIGRVRLAAPVWMLVLPGGAIDVLIDELRLQLRRLPDGEWNVSELQPSGSLEMPERLPLPSKKVNFQLTGSQIYLEPDERTYALAANANSPSLASQPLQWSIELSTSDGSSLSASGAFGNLTVPKEISGRATLTMKRLDLRMIPPLVPQLPVMYPHGTVEEGEVELHLAGVTQFHAAASFDLRDISLPDIGHETAARLSRGSVRFAMTRDNEKWILETLSLEGPDGSLRLTPGGWFQIGDDAWRGKLDLRVDLQDTEPAARALAMLLPDPLLLTGPMSIRTSVDGAVSLDPKKPWAERLDQLKANFELSQAKAQWRAEPLADIVAQIELNEGHVTVSHLGAAIGKGYAKVQGDLTIGDNPGGSLSWIVSDVSLAKLLDSHVRAFDITKAAGQLTFDGTAYRLESDTAIGKLSVDREALAGRDLRVDNARLECAGTLPPTFARLNVTSCHLKAVQGDLSSRQGQIDLGATPALQLDLEGWLGGPFLNALVPEISAAWPQKVNLKGPLTVPFTGETWPNMTWQFNVDGKDFLYVGLEFSDLRARVTKSVDRLDFDISGRRGPGSITATGSLQLEPKNVATVELNAERIPFQRKIKQAYELAGTASGSVRMNIDAQGQRASFRSDLKDVKVSRGGKLVSELANGVLTGELRRTGQSGLSARGLSLVGDRLDVRVRDSYLPLDPKNKAPFKLDVVFNGEGSWLGLAASLAGADNVLTSGQSQLSLRLESQPDHFLESMKGKGQLKLARLTFRGQSLSDADLVFDLKPRSIQITRGEVHYQGGRLDLAGNALLPVLKGSGDEQLALDLTQLPVRHVQPLANYRREGPASLVTETRVSGKVLLTRPSGDNLTVSAELESEPIKRWILQNKKNIFKVELPPLQASVKFISRNSLDRWTVELLAMHGQGAHLSLTNGQMARKDSGYEVGGLLTLKLPPEFLQGLAMGYLSPRVDLNGSLEASGRTMWRIALARPFREADIDYSGTVNIQKLQLDADTLSALHLTVRLASGHLDVQKGEASLLGGRVWLPSPSQVDIQGPAHAFNVHVAAKNVALQAYGGRQISLANFLGLLMPVFLIRHDSDKKPVSVKGVLQFDLQLNGTYQKVPGWSRSANGQGFFRIDDGAVEGSSLVSSIIARSLLMPTNVVNNSIAALFSKDGKVGRELVDLGGEAFRFQTIQSPITITNGDIFLERNLKVSSPELGLTVNGHSNLEGELDYNVDTDLIKRVRFGEITDLPNKIPVIGKVLSFLNPFTYLDGIELRARVTGNILKTGPDGQSEVRVETSVVDTKAG